MATKETMKEELTHKYHMAKGYLKMITHALEDMAMILNILAGEDQQ